MPYKDPIVRREKGREAHRRFLARKRLAREAEVEAKFAARSRPSDLDCCWAAGYFEGEGTLTITPSRAGRHRPTYTRPNVSLTSVDRSTTDWFHERWPGFLDSRVPAGNARRAHRWVLSSGLAIRGFLVDLDPYWRTERVRTKADLLLEDVLDRRQGERSDPEYHDRLSSRMAEIRRLNRRGRE